MERVLFLGLAIILFLFGLTPMPYPGPFASSSMLEDSTPGYIETDLPFVWGSHSPVTRNGRALRSSSTPNEVHLEGRMPLMYLLGGRCSTLGVEAYAIAEAKKVMLGVKVTIGDSSSV